MEHDRGWLPCSSSIFLVNSHLHHSYKRPKFHCLGCKNYTSTWSSSSSFFVVFTNIKYFTYKSRGLGQAKPEPSHEWRLRPGLRFDEAKAAAFRPSRAVHSTSVVPSLICASLPCSSSSKSKILETTIKTLLSDESKRKKKTYQSSDNAVSSSGLSSLFLARDGEPLGWSQSPRVASTTCPNLQDVLVGRDPVRNIQAKIRSRQFDNTRWGVGWGKPENHCDIHPDAISPCQGCKRD